MKYRPFVVIEVSGGVAECAISREGKGKPEVYIIDWDNIKAGDEPPEIPDRVMRALDQATRESLEEAGERP